HEYNPEKSRELLQEAGYEDGISITLNTFIHARPYVSNPVDAAEIIKDNLSKAGIDATIETNEWGTHSGLMRNGDYQAGFSGWYDIAYPSNFLKTMLLEGSNANWQPEEMVDLAQQALSTYDRDEQERIYREMQVIAHEEVPTIPIAHNDYTAASSAAVKGFRLDVIGNVIVTDVEMD
ncbi:MAG: ABC transporter substrate-binding protein, partial [Spirochaetaceae bacterium]